MVAPVRWATPGTDVDCATHPWLSASATIQSTSTPPPCPPMAITAMASGLVLSSATGRSGAATFIGGLLASPGPRGRAGHRSARDSGCRSDSRRGCRENDATAVAAALEPADHSLAQPGEEDVEPGRIVDDVGPVERRTEHRGFRDLAAIAAADTG